VVRSALDVLLVGTKEEIVIVPLGVGVTGDTEEGGLVVVEKPLLDCGVPDEEPDNDGEMVTVVVRY